jgi:hypothetical protein
MQKWEVEFILKESKEIKGAVHQEDNSNNIHVVIILIVD